MEFLKFQKAAGSGAASSSEPMPAACIPVPNTPLVADKKGITQAASSDESGDDSSSSKSDGVPEGFVPVNDSTPAWFAAAAQTAGDPAPPLPVPGALPCPASAQPLPIKDDKKKKSKKHKKSKKDKKHKHKKSKKSSKKHSKKSKKSASSSYSGSDSSEESNLSAAGVFR